MASPFIKRYLLALDRYKWAGLAGFLGVLGAAGVIALQPPPRPAYQSEGVLRQNVPLVSFTATGTEVRQIGQAFITEDFLLADALLEQVSQELARRNIEILPDEIRANARIGVGGEDEDNGAQRVVAYRSFVYASSTVLRPLVCRRPRLARAVATRIQADRRAERPWYQPRSAPAGIGRATKYP